MKPETESEMASECGPIQIHPENTRYFQFRGRPLVLVTATEHYGSVVNRRFDYVRYLNDAADKKQTLTRVFLLFRELQTPRNPYSPVKPESPDFLTPYKRTGPGVALDGEPKYDLDRWNPEFFERLRDFLAQAAARDIIVEVTLFSNVYSDTVWALHPLRAENNINKIGKVSWQEYLSKTERTLFDRQKEYVRKIVSEVNSFDNIYFELCNEPGGGEPNHVAVDQVEEWQSAIGKLIRSVEANLPKKHLVFAMRVFNYVDGSQHLDRTLADKEVNAVNLHPGMGVTYRNVAYPMGGFMEKDILSESIRDLYIACYDEGKPLIIDEDNAASLYRDHEGWTIHRKRAWTTVMSGGHYDYIDFSITVGSEAGTVESQKKLRTWMKNLSEFIHSIDFIHSKPKANFLTVKPPNCMDVALVSPEEYAIYLVDSREIQDPTYGDPIHGKIAFTLPKGEYTACLYSPLTGQHSPCIKVDGGEAMLDLPSFSHDVVIQFKRALS